MDVTIWAIGAVAAATLLMRKVCALPAVIITRMREAGNASDATLGVKMKNTVPIVDQKIATKTNRQKHKTKTRSVSRANGIQLFFSSASIL